MELLTKFTETIAKKNDEESKPKKNYDTKEPKVSTFALYIDEKLRISMTNKGKMRKRRFFPFEFAEEINSSMNNSFISIFQT